MAKEDENAEEVVLTWAEEMPEYPGGYDKEALRIVKSMPKFKPGKQQGKEVRVEYLIRVIFELPENKK